jgi:hypothetical protein
VKTIVRFGYFSRPLVWTISSVPLSGTARTKLLLERFVSDMSGNPASSRGSRYW